MAVERSLPLEPRVRLVEIVANNSNNNLTTATALWITVQQHLSMSINRLLLSFHLLLINNSSLQLSNLPFINRSNSFQK